MDLLSVPLYLLIPIIFMFGVVIGSFLNVFIIRFHTGKSLSGSSHCMSCGKMLRWYDLFPLLSYLWLRGRCGQCGARIPARYFWVEIISGILAVVAVLSTADIFLWPFMFLLAMVLVVIAVYDIDHMIIPHEFVWSLVAMSTFYLGYLFYLGDLTYLGVVYNLLAGAGSGLFFYILWWYSGGRWLGLGDAKLALPLGVIVGPWGAFSMLTLSFWVGAIISLAMIYFQYLQKRKKPALQSSPSSLTMKSEVPFAPFLLIGFSLVMFLQVNVLDWFAYVW